MAQASHITTQRSATLAQIEADLRVVHGASTAGNLRTLRHFAERALRECEVRRRRDEQRREDADFAAFASWWRGGTNAASRS